MNVHLDERAIPDGLEAVNLAGLDDENVPSATLKRLSVHGPYSAAFPDKLDPLPGMPMRPPTLARQPAEQKHGDAQRLPARPRQIRVSSPQMATLPDGRGTFFSSLRLLR